MHQTKLGQSPVLPRLCSFQIAGLGEFSRLSEVLLGDEQTVHADALAPLSKEVHEL